MKYGINPYLPFWETVPDGEPHVFDGRVYVYGSHDDKNYVAYCVDDYVCWSAPVDDLSDWRCEGVSYKKTQDPINGAPYDKPLPAYEEIPALNGVHYLYAPDCAKGPDGRYYLYYALDFVDVISVAVSDRPQGPFEFLDYVLDADGRVPEAGRKFDPAILSDETGNYLYYGFAPAAKFPGMKDKALPGALMVRLADDMHTVISDPVVVANGIETAAGTAYEAHPFFEASSIRHFGDWYYFVYSSLQGNELCYGMARTPEGPFEYKGVIVSNGDLGYEGNTLATNYTGNNHGGLAEINGQYYIFWHRHTHGHAFARQGCADRVEILPDGTIPQIEITSCGPNGGPLPAKEKWPSYIACHLTGSDRSAVGRVLEPGPDFVGTLVIPDTVPYITEEEDPDGEKGLKPLIYNLREGCITGFKYFLFDGTEKKALLELRGDGQAEILLDGPEGRVAGVVSVSSDRWHVCAADIAAAAGKHSVYIRVTKGHMDFASIAFTD